MTDLVTPTAARQAAGLETTRLGPSETTRTPKTVYEFLEAVKPELARAIPEHMNPDRLARIALTAVRRSEMQARKKGPQEPSLATTTPESFAGAILMCAATGLEPDVFGEAYLVPYKGECTFIPGYMGLIKLWWQHPLSYNFSASFVCENDEFDYEYGSRAFLHHKPMRRGQDGKILPRGDIIGVYAVATLRTGAVRPLFLPMEEAVAIRGKEGPSGQIKDPQHWMDVKTGVRQLVKTLPKSPKLNWAIEGDEQSGAELLRADMPRLAAAEPPAVEPGPPADATPFAPAPEDAEPQPEPQREKITVQKQSKKRTGMIEELRKRHGEGGALVAVRFASNNVYLTMDTAPDAALEAALAFSQERIAEILEDQLLAQEPPEQQEH